jgi:adenine/guanine phosphoribosyltransferase-like PRPP-binding protein
MNFERLTAMNRIMNDGSHLIDPEGDPLQTLRNCEGYYTCPTDAEGKPLGPIVGYTAPYTPPGVVPELKWVGLTYYNFSKADPWPAVLTFFAEAMVRRLTVRHMLPDVIVGAPWAGVKFSQEVARLLGCRHIFAEKKGDEVILGRYEGEIHAGDVVLVGEELVNNTSTTGKLVKLIEDADGKVLGIFCAINRSFPFKETFWKAPESDPLPIIGVIERATPQYHQDDPLVAQAIADGRIVWKPKYAWDKMEAAMQTFGQRSA